MNIISKLYENIAAGLKKIKTCTIYQEDVPQNFKPPCFMVTFYDQNPTRHQWPAEKHRPGGCVVLPGG